MNEFFRKINVFIYPLQPITKKSVRILWRTYFAAMPPFASRDSALNAFFLVRRCHCGPLVIKKDCCCPYESRREYPGGDYGTCFFNLDTFLFSPVEVNSNLQINLQKSQR